MVPMTAKDLPWCPLNYGIIMVVGNRAQDEAGMQKEQHPRGLKLFSLCPHPSLQGTPSLLCTRNREVRISRKIIVKENQPQEVDSGWLKLTFAPKERHVARRQRSSESLLPRAWGLVLSSRLPLSKGVQGPSSWGGEETVKYPHLGSPRWDYSEDRELALSVCGLVNLSHFSCPPGRENRQEEKPIREAEEEVHALWLVILWVLHQ